MNCCHERNAPAVLADVFGALPGEGTWDRVVLADGNIDIGGDPVRLLRRACSLLGPGGAVVLETTPSWRGLARLHDQRVPAGDWFPWAVAGRDALPALALGAGLRVAEVSAGRRRQFARLDPLP